MIIRNAVYTKDGNIDCEVNHPQHGWIPHTIPKDGGFESLAMFELAAQTAAPYEPDPIEELENARANKIREINALYVESITPLIREYPEIEQKTWLAQESEARAYLEWEEFGGDSDPPLTPVLDNILLGRNGENGTETLKELCLAVLENADMFTLAQQLTGKRQRLVKEARLAEAVEEIELINW